MVNKLHLRKNYIGNLQMQFLGRTIFIKIYLHLNQISDY